MSDNPLAPQISTLMEARKKSTFEELMNRIAAGSEEAVWEAIDRYSTNILRVVRRSLSRDLRQKVDSFDIVQSVWKSLLAKEVTLHGVTSPSEFVAYVAQMARNKVYEVDRHYKKVAARDVRKEVSLKRPDDEGQERSPSQNEHADTSLPPPDEIVDVRERWHRSMQACGQRANAIVTMKMQRASDEEIGAKLGVSSETVRREIRNLLKSFQE